MASTGARLAIGCLLLFLGGVFGLLLGSFASYALAGLFTPSRETQAYLTLLVVPAVAVVGAVTFVAGAQALKVKQGPSVPLAVVGAVVLLGVLALGLSWHHRARPAQVRVRNETGQDFRNVFVGGDFRRSTRVGALAAGETSGPVAVDLAQPGSFDALEGQASGGGYVRHRLTAEESQAVADGDYAWVVREAGGAFSYALERE